MMKLLHASAQRFPEALAVETPKHAVTFAELNRIVEGTARNMLISGTGTVAVCLDDAWEMLLLILAALRAGVTVCPISSRFPTGTVQAHAKLVGADRLITRRAECRAPIQPESWVGRHATGSLPESERESDVVIWTSGSTGQPKAAVLGARSLHLNALGANCNLPLGMGDRWLLALPLYHVGGLGVLFRSLVAGATVVIPDASGTLPGIIRQCRITHVSLVATQLGRILRQEEGSAPGALKGVLVGGGTVSLALLHTAAARGYPVRTTYGLTEMASQVTALPEGAKPGKRATSGCLLPYREMRISAHGEILVRGPVLFKGYLERGELRCSLDPDGWFHTGDLGKLDDEGFLDVTGRRDNMFVSGGENVYPEEIERVLCKHLGLDQAVVVPVPDPEFGFRPVAFVQGAKDAPSAKELAPRLKKVLPKFKLPVILSWPDEDSSMKVDRARLRRLAIQVLGST